MNTYIEWGGNEILHKEVDNFLNKTFKSIIIEVQNEKQLDGLYFDHKVYMQKGHLSGSRQIHVYLLY